MAEKLFPERQRCKKCSKGLPSGTATTRDRERRPLVVLGLYCSYACAGLPAPGQDVTTAPRSCRTGSDREGWRWKNAYRFVGEIPAPIRAEQSSSWYWCDACGLLHIGHSRIDLSKEPTREVRGLEDLADFFAKARGGATHKQVADALNARGHSPKVNGARIKEAEDPSHDTGSRLVLALVDLYRAKLALVLPTTGGRRGR